MRYLLFASHGRLAEGMLHSVEMITGKQESVWTMGAYLEEKVDIKSQINACLRRLMDEDELIVVTDIFGGSVNNEFMNVLDDKRIHLIAGLNLAMVIELVTMNNREKDTVKLIKSALNNSKSSMRYCNLDLKCDTDDEEF
ncbi:PTS sugar transporter subunit IIA [Neobacillus sp. FSL H8-0543]|uniref:PTS sugar transporter subunit IIA n=1 Tax=Neobacillus sp. FSL H8-0543 TaxID=2954672 RepID=UPI0031591EAF